MRTLIIGQGQVGGALGKILEDYKPFFLDLPKRDLLESIDIMHICFSYSDEFISYVKSYREGFRPKYTIVHSTVPVGTCRQLNAIHSPIIGQHPFLEEGIRTFPKFLAGEQASEVADYFRRVGLKIILFDKQETTEASKLFLTEYYKVCIEFAQRVKEYCDEHDLSFHEVYTIPNQVYNSGYEKLGYKEFVRPVLQPIMTPISGHCVVPNSELLKMSEKDIIE